MDKIGTFLLPLIISFIVIFAFIKKVKMFDAFIEGAKDGISSTVSVIPPLVGLVTSISMLKASGALDMFAHFMSGTVCKIGIPAETIPLMLLRPISGSASLAIINNIFSNFGPDSFVGKVASVMMGSTETTFYAIAVYFGAVGIKNTRHTVPAALMADLTGFFMSVLTIRLLFYC